MTTKKLATIAAALLISVAPAAAIINQPVHTVQAATQSQKGKVTLKLLTLTSVKNATSNL